MNVTVDTTSPIPPFEQLRAGIAQLIAVGRLPAGTQLPPVRQLAGDLALAPGTVQRAYAELQAAGLVRSRARRGVIVADTVARPTGQQAATGEHLAIGARQFVDHARRLGVDDAQIRSALEQELET